MNMHRWRGLLLALLSLCSPCGAANPLADALNEREAAHAAAIASQQRIDLAGEEMESSVPERRAALDQIADLRVYNGELQALLADQGKELSSLERRLSGVAIAGEQTPSLIMRMIEALERFLAQDIPFLSEERKERLQRLKRLVKRPDIAPQEKYRSVLETYRIELDYGRTIQAYSGQRRVKGDSRLVDFLRIGRLALFYASPDGDETGYWDRSAGGWRSLPQEYQQAVRLGLRMARKEIPPDFIKLPIVTARQEATAVHP